MSEVCKGGDAVTGCGGILGAVCEVCASTQSCGICGGTGAVDSGGFTPWGAGIDVKCGHCNGTGREPRGN